MIYLSFVIIQNNSMLAIKNQDEEITEIPLTVFLMMRGDVNYLTNASKN